MDTNTTNTTSTDIAWATHSIGENTTAFFPATTSKYGLYGPLEEFQLFWIGYYINLYFLWVVFAIGFPGNMASIITILRMPPVTSSSAYIALLAAVDTLAIIDKLLFHQLTLYDINIGAGGCRTLFYLGSFFAMYANWILVAMTVERFVAVLFPLQIKKFSSRRNAATIIGVIAIAIAIVQLHFIWTATQITKPNGDVDCGFFEESQNFINSYWYWIDGVLYAILPCILLFVFNFIIGFGIWRSGKIQKDLTNSKSDQMAEKFRQQRQITVMLVVISVVFVLLTFPNCLFYIVKRYWTYTRYTPDHATYYLTNQLIYVLSDSHHAVNFYLYFLSGKRFRRRFFDTICCRKATRRPMATVTHTTNSNHLPNHSNLFTTPSTSTHTIETTLSRLEDLPE